MGAAPKVVALIATYNEEDVIAECLLALTEQGVGAYVLDDGSTDGTVAEVQRFEGKGLVGFERLAEPGASPTFSLRKIIARKQALARTLDADWFINHDADEFREGPWPGVDLPRSIEAVEALGFDAIDFAVFDFWPTHDRFQKGMSVREAFTRYAAGQAFNRTQIRCWKKRADVELVESAGHEARYPGRKVFPLRFILRHYPWRGSEHARRKVLTERKARFDPAERKERWHVQYDGAGESTAWLKREDELVAWDGDRVRLELALKNREAEPLLARVADLERQLDAARAKVEELESARTRLAREAAELEARRAATQAQLEQSERRLSEAIEFGARQQKSVVALSRELEQRAAWLEAVQTQLAELQASMSWKLTGPMREVLRRLRGY